MILKSKAYSLYLSLFSALMLAFFWYLNWQLEGPRTHWTFFPLWLFFIVFLNSLIIYRKGYSLMIRFPLHFTSLFLISAPLWWVFEAINARAQYWIYLPQDWLPFWSYLFFASLNFSVVLPAIFSGAELMMSFRIIKDSKPFIKTTNDPIVPRLFFILGWLMLVITLVWPQYSMALIWISLFFIIDPINYWCGYTSILKNTATGDWSVVWALWISSLICGFAWELWNFYSWPKWIYEIPYVDFWYIFEMPALGYLGYLPFSLELYAMYHLIIGLIGYKPKGHSNFLSNSLL